MTTQQTTTIETAIGWVLDQHNENLIYSLSGLAGTGKITKGHFQLHGRIGTLQKKMYASPGRVATFLSIYENLRTDLAEYLERKRPMVLRREKEANQRVTSARGKLADISIPVDRAIFDAILDQYDSLLDFGDGSSRYLGSELAEAIDKYPVEPGTVYQRIPMSIWIRSGIQTQGGLPGGFPYSGDGSEFAEN